MVIASAMLSYAAEPVATNAPAATPEVVKEEAKCPVSVGATLDLYSAYVWHGCVLNDEPVWQPDLALTYSFGDYGAVTADAWMNFDATGNNSQRSFVGMNEIDYTLQYAVTLSDFSLGIGHIWYTFPAIGDTQYYPSTREIFVSAAYNNDIVTPFAKVYYDYARVDGAYATIGLRKEVAVIDKLTAGAEVALGGANHTYTQYYFGADNSAWFTDGTAALYLKYTITDNFYIGARLAWTSVMDNDLKDVYHEDNLLWGGINLGASL
jgi:hypothetical protein